MDKVLVMDKLFKFLREFPEFENLMDMQYDERNGLVRVKIGISEKVILIKDDSTWMSITREVLAGLEKESLWNVYLDTMNGKPVSQNPHQFPDAIVADVIYMRETICIR